MSQLVIQVAVARLDDAAFVAVPLLVDIEHEPRPAVVSPTAEQAVKDLRARLLREQRLRETDPQPLSLERLECLQFRIDWPRSGAPSLAVRVDVVQGYDRQAEQWIAVVPVLAVVAYADQQRDLRNAVAHKLVASIPEQWLARVSLLEPPRLRELRLPALLFGGVAPRPELPDILRERCEELSSSLPPERRVLGRDYETLQLAELLHKRPLRLLLVGDRGVGKSALLAGAVTRLRAVDKRRVDGRRSQDELPRVVRTSAARLVAGARWLGEWEEQVQEVVEAVQESAAILAIDNLADLLTTGGEDAGSSVGAFLVSVIDRGELPVVIEATDEELDACARLLPRLAEALQVMRVYDLDSSRLLQVLQKTAAAGSPDDALEIERGSCEAAADLFGRFLPYRPRVHAIQFVRDACAAARNDQQSLSAQLLVRRFCAWTGLPRVLVDDQLPLTRDAVCAALERRVIGQPTAIAQVAELLLVAKAGLCDPRRPIGVLLLCGPTGVGKTELCKALGDFLFEERPEQDRLLRLDMSEYGLPGAARRFVQAGNRPAAWLERLRRDPFAVVLFDEIEKADPEIFDVLLSVFDEGRLIDSFGRQTTLCSTVLVMTSNLGVKADTGLGFGESPGADYRQAVARFFRPEFGNRIDAVVPFAALDRQAIERITSKELQAIAARDGMQRRGLRLQWEPAVVAQLAAIGFDPELGARPLQRAIEHAVMVPLSRLLVEQPDVREAMVQLRPGVDGSVRAAFV